MKLLFGLLLSVPAVLGRVLSGTQEVDARAEGPRISYYGDDKTNLAGGACQFSSLPSGLYGAAISKSLWDGAGACGSCIKITGPSKKPITVMIVDRCPGCEPDHFDLFPNAFKAAGGTETGRTYVTYEYVPCGITTPLSVRTEGGASQWWFSMQVTEANRPVKSLEVSVDGGNTWQQTQRRDYNFFQKLDRKGFGTKAVDIRVTSTSGKTIIIKNVNADQGGKTFKAGSNF